MIQKNAAGTAERGCYRGLHRLGRAVINEPCGDDMRNHAVFHKND